MSKPWIEVYMLKFNSMVSMQYDVEMLYSLSTLCLSL